MSTTVTAASQSKRIQEINRLLALAEGTSHPEEAVTARERAERLMVRYGVDAAMLESAAAGEQRAATEEIVQERIEFVHPQCVGLMQMGNAIAQGFGTVRVLRSGNSKHYEILYLIGFKSDVENVTRLVKSMEIQGLAAMQSWWKGYLKGEGQWLTGYERFMAKRQFLASFGSGAASRIRKATREAQQEVTGSEIVLLDRKARVDNWMDTNYGKLGKGRGHRGSAYGAAEGYVAGQRANTTGVGTGNSGALGR